MRKHGDRPQWINRQPFSEWLGPLSEGWWQRRLLVMLLFSLILPGLVVVVGITQTEPTEAPIGGIMFAVLLVFLLQFSMMLWYVNASSPALRAFRERSPHGRMQSVQARLTAAERVALFIVSLAASIAIWAPVLHENLLLLAALTFVAFVLIGRKILLQLHAVHRSHRDRS